jgi:TPR repeat protein
VIFPQLILRWLLIASLWACPVLLHGEESIEELRTKAEQGDALAQNVLAGRYSSGEGVVKNEAEAIKWYRKAAEQGLALAQYNLGLAFAAGKGVEKNDVESTMWIRKAAEQNLAVAQFFLGLSYSAGTGVEKNDAEAVKWYCMSADQNEVKAQYKLGEVYSYGRGVEKNDAEAVKWYRKAADQGLAEAQYKLASRYEEGKGIKKDLQESYKWYRKSAEQRYFDSVVKLISNYSKNLDQKELIKWHHIIAEANIIEYFSGKFRHDWNTYSQAYLGAAYLHGKGAKKNPKEAIKWLTVAADKGSLPAQENLGIAYSKGIGVEKNNKRAADLFRKAADKGYASSQNQLGILYALGEGVVKNEVEAYKWWLIAAAEGFENSKKNINIIESKLTLFQRSEGQRLAQEWEAGRAQRDAEKEAERKPETAVAGDEPKSTGTGFIITRNGYLVTNHHVVEDASKVRVQTSAGLLDAEVVRVDDTSDLALLKVAGTFEALPVVSSRNARLGATVATVGFPNVGLQGFEPKLSKGDISSLAGIQDDVRYFQISVPVQPGNSGGALVDEQGNVVGVVSAQLSQKAALESTGTLAQSVNYAVKSSYLLSFLEAVPEASAEMPDAKTHEQKFEAVVDDVKKATVLIIGY